jgi:probable addiction module antidote protein
MPALRLETGPESNQLVQILVNTLTATPIPDFTLRASDFCPWQAAGIARALGNIARAQGMAKVARASGLGRESLYKALSDTGNPSFATVLKVAKALGLRLHAEAA